MSDSHLPTVMIQQPEMNPLYAAERNYSLETCTVPQTFMAISSTTTNPVQPQVLPSAEGVVTYLSPAQVPVTHTDDCESGSIEAGRTTNLSDVHDLFPHTAVPTVVAQDKVITISFQQTPEQDVPSLYQATLENYPMVTICEPQSPTQGLTGTINKTAKPEGKEEKQLYTCEQCQATFRRSSNLKVHLQRHLGNKPFACHQCSAAFVEEKNLKRHMVAHRTDRPHVCLECGLAFVESGNLTRHMLTHSGSKDYVCDTCGAAFSKSHHLKEHLVSHAVSKNSHREHVCEECQNVFNNPFQLRKHIKSVHSGGGGRRYSCPQCGAVFGWWNIFRRHLLTHKGEKPFVCEKCNEGFIDNLTLRQHKRTHARNKNNACHVCEAAFDRPSHLVRHMRVHTGEKPNVCTECGAAFLERNKLARHMRIHNGATGGVVCELCGARFTQTRHLTHHMKTHQDPQDKVKPEEESKLHSRKKGKCSRKNGSVAEKRGSRTEKEAVIKYITVSVHTKRTNRNENTKNLFTTEESKGKCVGSDHSGVNQNRQSGHGKRKRGRRAEVKNHSSEDSHIPSETNVQEITDTEGHHNKKSRIKEERIANTEMTCRNGRKKRTRGINNSWEKDPLPSLAETDGDETDEYDVGYNPDQAVTPYKIHPDDQTNLKTCIATDISKKDDVDESMVVSFSTEKIASPGMEENSEQDTGLHGEGEVLAAKEETSDGMTGETIAGDWMVMTESDDVQVEDIGKSRDTQGDSVDTMSHTHPFSVMKNGTEANPAMDCTTVTDVDNAQVISHANTASTQHPREACTVQQQSYPHSVPVPICASQECPEPLPCDTQQQPQEETENTGFVLYACNQCSAVFNSSFSLKLHKRVHKTRVSVCLRCGEVFKGSAELMVHREVCTGFLPLKSASDPAIPLLPATPNSDRLLRRKPHGCHMCEASFDLISKLKLHMQFHTDSRKHVCNECGASFSKSTDLRAHIRTHTGDRPFVCNLCGASYTQSSTLSVHMKTHSGIKPHVCKVCGAAFPRYGRLKAHMRCHSGEKPCVCKLCGAAFKWSQTLLRHMNTQHSSTAFTCKLCRETFHNEKQMKAHLQVHSGERPHSCPQCKKAFKKLVQLRRHSRVHTGDWPFLCDECGAGFGSAASLKIHMRCHTGEKPFVCEECGRAFRISSHLRRHMASHTDDPIYVTRQPVGKMAV